jgi:hypothetical protein
MKWQWQWKWNGMLTLLVADIRHKHSLATQPDN